jgi:hypothetical protein
VIPDILYSLYIVIKQPVDHTNTSQVSGTLEKDWLDFSLKANQEMKSSIFWDTTPVNQCFQRSVLPSSLGFKGKPSEKQAASRALMALHP